jgi:hypothetical protein
MSAVPSNAIARPSLAICQTATAPSTSAPVDRVEHEGEPVGEEQGSEHRGRVDDRGDLGDGVADHRDREVRLAASRERDADRVRDGGARDRYEHQAGEGARDPELVRGRAESRDEPARDERGSHAGDREQHDRGT